MNDGPKVNGNPLKISVYSLIVCYIIGEFIIPKYPLIYFLNLVGIIGLILSFILFFLGFDIFKSYKENPLPTSETKKLIKTGIFSYTRNPIYVSFVLFHFSMFLIFENVMYLLSSITLAFWIHNYVIKLEEKYLIKHFPEEYYSYMKAVNRWIIF